MVDPESPSQKLVGAVLNARWKLLRLLGEGGMGAVFEADSLRGEGRCAVKLLHAEFSSEPQVVARFFAEAQASQSLQHPNITRVFEAARAEDGTPYLVMELLHGLPLSAYLDGEAPMKVEQAAPVMHEVLQALSLAHARRIVHRDLKPENIFLARDARGGTHAKVLDFGIAKVMDVAGGMGHKTRTGALLGTPGYMSPEQVKSSKDVDPRSDLWSVGSMFYELITGRELFPAENDFARLTRVLSDEVPPIETTAPALAVWGQFFRRALAKDPAQRFQSAEEMDTSLMMLARGAPAVPEWSAAPTPRASQVAGAPPPNGPATSPKGGVGLTVPIAAHPGPIGVSPTPSSSPPQSSWSGAPPNAAPPNAAPPNAVHPNAAHPNAAHSNSAHPNAALPAYGPSNSAPMSMPPGVPVASVPIAVIHPPLAPLAGAPGAVGSTHVSAQKPPGAPAFVGIQAPPVQVVSAPPLHKSAPWWLVGVIAFVCLGLGFVAGFLVGGG